MSVVSTSDKSDLAAAFDVITLAAPQFVFYNSFS